MLPKYGPLSFPLTCTVLLFFLFELVRQIEDHEVVHTVIQNWAPDSHNSLQLVEKITKYDLFDEPAVSAFFVCYQPVVEAVNTGLYIL